MYLTTRRITNQWDMTKLRFALVGSSLKLRKSGMNPVLKASYGPPTRRYLESAWQIREPR